MRTRRTEVIEVSISMCNASRLKSSVTLKDGKSCWRDNVFVERL